MGFQVSTRRALLPLGPRRFRRIACPPRADPPGGAGDSPAPLSRSGACPWPKFCGTGQTRSHWVVLDASADADELLGVPCPMIVRFVLPKRLSGALQHLVGAARGRSF